MKRIFGTLFSVLLACTGLVVLTTSSSQADDHTMVICHATSSEQNPFVRIEVADVSEGGHFDNNGTPLAGHEDDLLLGSGAQCPDGEAPPECPDGDENGEAPGCEAPPECPDGDENGEAPGCEAPPECPDGDENGEAPGCEAPPEHVTVCHKLGNGNYNIISFSEEALDAHLAHGDIYPVPANGCGGSQPPPPPPPDGGVGGIVEETRVEHRFRCGQAIRIERHFEDGVLVDTDRTVTPTGEDCSPAELRISPDVWERSHVEETGL